ncbi:MAG: L-2-hydroxyglutarate oxidase [Acidobacteria bacterium]|nr:MAG: L-2-hydroxyglutarate oxidase [Acidobacteriota bacterium]
MGAGIVGLATARALVARQPGLAVLVLDKEDSIACHQTGRNSGVIHSGIYYPPGSNKASMVARGREQLIELCRHHRIAYELCGKLVVATSAEEVHGLARLQRRAAANAIPTSWLPAEGIAEYEPRARGLAALHVPSAGIVDFSGVSRALVEELHDGGGNLRLDSELVNVDESVDGLVLDTSSGKVRSRWLVNCAGLQSDRVAAMAHSGGQTRILPFRGEYFELVPSRRHLVKDLIYPVPDPRFPFLGVHFTRMVDGTVHAGPNAVIALSREGYEWKRADAGDIAEMLANPGVWRLGRRYWRTGLAELKRSLSKRSFVSALQGLVPDVGSEDLVRSESGVRAQALLRDGSLVDDFEFGESHRAVSVINAPSPAATAALAIGDEIALRVIRKVGG